MERADSTKLQRHELNAADAGGPGQHAVPHERQERDQQYDPLILPLDASEATLVLVGGKGASLARMAAAGLPVPGGFHITTIAYRRFVAANALQEAILAAAASGSPDEPATLERAAGEIRGLFERGTIPEAIAAAIRQAYAGLGAGDREVAVRSSATAEDLPGMSFAGQQETYLNMRGETMLLDAVKRCWSSLWTARAIGYRLRQGIRSEDVSLAVVVQELVPADVAGILFTANPLTGARDQVMINAAWGLGEAIVGGLVTPDSVVVDKTTGTILAQEIADKAVMTVRTHDGTGDEPVPSDRRAQAVLDAAQTAELARLGGQIEQLYGQPMDIEWAMHNGQIFVVQARPITALPEPAGAASTEWNLPSPNGHYMRASVIELLPDPLSPLFATLGLPAWNESTTDLANTIGIGDELHDLNMLLTIDGYAYYDVTFTPAQIVRLLPALPRVAENIPPLLMRAQERWEQETQPAYAAVARRWETHDLQTTRAAALLDGTHDIVLAAAQHYISIQSGILPAAYMSESLFTKVYDRLIRRPSDPPALTFMLGFDSTPLQSERSLYDLALWAREQPSLAAYLARATGVQLAAALARQAIPAEVADAAWQAFRDRFATHLARFGHMIYDLDFAKAVPADDPAPLLETLRFFLSGQAADPRARQAAAASERDHATATMLEQRRGLRLALFWRLLCLAQRYAPLRERALADVGLGWPVLRRMLHEIGRRLASAGAVASADDVFWLTLDELRAAARALDDGQRVENVQESVAERRARWEHMRHMTPPVALPLKDGAKLMGIDFSRWMPARTDQADGDVIAGQGTSPGRVSGLARVIHGPEEFALMRPGDILVTKITTPAWTPLFALAAGVVSDVGGPLSHGSIVAREYHIPAVMGTGVATARIHSDQRVTVDGDAGTVTLVD